MDCIIIDDEPIARRGMRRLIGGRPELILTGEFGDTASAGEFLTAYRPGLVFLDIQLQGSNGIEFARTIPHDTMVIFTTAYSEYALDSYEVNAIDYLVKPIDPARFNKAMDKAVEYQRLIADASQAEEARKVDETVIIKADRRYHRIRVADILMVEGLKDYVVFHLPERRIVARMTIRSVADMLPATGFLRVNKSYIVNLDHVTSFDTADITVGSHEITIGPTYRDTVLGRLLGNAD